MYCVDFGQQNFHFAVQILMNVNLCPASMVELVRIISINICVTASPDTPEQFVNQVLETSMTVGNFTAEVYIL